MGCGPPAQIPIPLSLVLDTFPGSSGPAQSRSRVDDPCDAALILVFSQTRSFKLSNSDGGGKRAEEYLKDGGRGYFFLPPDT
jgi:hypothetical protein